MVLEAAILNIHRGQNAAFEAAFRQAAPIIASIDGYISHTLQHCLEDEHKYLLLVQWETLASHTVNFRRSPQYQDWKRLLHHFYDPFPVAEHFEAVV